MMIEQNTNYAYKLKFMDNPTFDKVRDLSTKFYRELPQTLQDELFEALNRGIDILDSEPQMTAYLFAFGKMHQAKLNYAFGKLPKEFFEQPEINIIDYGCGQALGTMCYADFLRENGYLQKVKTITLIEPSEICLKRAALHASVFFSDAEIKTVNKKFDDLTQDDIVCNEETPTLHILSNVLDMLNFDLNRFSAMIKDNLNSYNQFVCVGPYFNFAEKDERMVSFASLLDGNNSYLGEFDKYEFVSNKTWTAQICCFLVEIHTASDSINSNAIVVLEDYTNDDCFSADVTDEDLQNGVEDEFGVVYSTDGKRLLKCNNPELEFYNIKKGTKIICDKAFRLNRNIREITIPSSVYSIGENAFGGCWSLQQISIPSSITCIRAQTFTWCKSLQRINIPNSITTIEDEAFSGCIALQVIDIPDSVTSIGSGAFSECESIQQITISKSISIINNKVFFRCKSLKQIIIPDSVISICDWAFAQCESIEQITFPKNLINIGCRAFWLCRSLIQVNLPNSVTCIDSWAFSQCRSLQQVVIPSSVTDIGVQVFWLSSLQQITIPVTIVSNVGFIKDCKSIPRIIIPKGSKRALRRELNKELWNKLIER